MRLSYSIPLLLTCLILSGCQTDNSIFNPLNSSSPDTPYEEQYGDENSVSYLRMHPTSFLCREVVGDSPYDWRIYSPGGLTAVYVKEVVHRGKTPSDCYRFRHGEERMKLFSPIKSMPSSDLCKLTSPFSISKFSADYNTDYVGTELKSRNFPINSCIEATGITPPTPLKKLASDFLCKKFKPFSVSMFKAEYQTTPVAEELKARSYPINACLNDSGTKPPVPLEDRRSEDLCKNFKPFLVARFSAEYKPSEIGKELKRRAFSLKSCLRAADVELPKNLSTLNIQTLCGFRSELIENIVRILGEKKSRKASMLPEFSDKEICTRVSDYSSTAMGDVFAKEASKRGYTPSQCDNLIKGKLPKVDVETGQFEVENRLLEKELSKRRVSAQDCALVSVKVPLSDETFLKLTPSKKITPQLSDLNLCKFLKYKTPPHLKSEVKKRGLRCDRLLALDAFDKAN
jgi:hypothetical protein